MVNKNYGGIQMTNKKFFIESNSIWYNGKQLSWGDLCNVLNELYEENELLKSDESIDSSILELKKENESLKFKLESTKSLLQRVKDYFDDMELIIDG